MEFTRPSVGSRTIASDAPSTHAMEQTTEKIDSISLARTGSFELGPAYILDFGP
jgi:hypothetical protein